MTTGAPSVDSRLLGPADTLTGGSGSALANLIPGRLPNGALCWVIAEDALYRFSRYSLETPDGTRVIPTSGGASVPGRWVQVTGTAAIDPLPTLLWVSAGFAGTPTGSIAAPFPTIQQGVDAIPVGGGGTLMMAPGTYPDAWSVPENLTINIQSEGFTQGGAGGGTSIAGPILGNGSHVRIQNCGLRNDITLLGSGTLYCYNLACHDFDFLQSGAGSWYVSMTTDGNESSEPGVIQCSQLVAENVRLNGAVSLSGPLSKLLLCTVQAPITFVGAPGTLLTDLYTLNSMRDSGASIINASIIDALDAPNRRRTIASPVFAAAGVVTVDVAIPDARPGDTFAVTNLTGLPTNVALGQPRCAVAGTVAITLIAVAGALGTNVDISLTRFNGGL